MVPRLYSTKLVDILFSFVNIKLMYRPETSVVGVEQTIRAGHATVTLCIHAGTCFWGQREGRGVRWRERERIMQVADGPALKPLRPLTSHLEEGIVMRSRTLFPVLPSYAYKQRQQKPLPTAIHSCPETGPTARVRARRTFWYFVKCEDPFP